MTRNDGCHNFSDHRWVARNCFEVKSSFRNLNLWAFKRITGKIGTVSYTTNAFYHSMFGVYILNDYGLIQEIIPSSLPHHSIQIKVVSRNNRISWHHWHTVYLKLMLESIKVFIGFKLHELFVFKWKSHNFLLSHQKRKQNRKNI